MIYFVEDDANIRELVIYTLKSTGFEAEGFEKAAPFWDSIKRQLPKLVLLDIMLPGEDGITILKKLRANSATKLLPIIMLSAKGAEYDKVIGLDNGADDYIAKPFGMMELISRVKALLRRTENNDEKELYTVGGLVVDVSKHLVTVNGEEITLTYKEFELLILLLKSGGNVLSRNQILESIWGYDFDGETRTVDVHIRTLRQKLGESEGVIETIRGVGYRIGGNNET